MLIRLAYLCGPESQIAARRNQVRPVPGALGQLWRRRGGGPASRAGEGRTDLRGDLFVEASPEPGSVVKFHLSGSFGGRTLLRVRVPDLAVEEAVRDGAGRLSNPRYSVGATRWPFEVDAVSRTAPNQVTVRSAGPVIEDRVSASSEPAMWDGRMSAPACHVYSTIAEVIHRLLQMRLRPPASEVLRAVDAYVPRIGDMVADGSERDMSGASYTPVGDNPFHPRIWYVGDQAWFEDVIIHEYGHHVIKCLFTRQDENAGFPSGGHSGDLADTPDLAFHEAWCNMFAFAMQPEGAHRGIFQSGHGAGRDMTRVPDGVASMPYDDRLRNENLISKCLVDVHVRHGFFYIWKTMATNIFARFDQFREHYTEALGDDSGKIAEFQAIVRENHLES
ncbi:MAG: hypothetical protein HYY17_02620 [Planctomycetes bacterium]|nr:hypothetical protein [Planctomycetota bacterium]